MDYINILRVLCARSWSKRRNHRRRKRLDYIYYLPEDSWFWICCRNMDLAKLTFFDSVDLKQHKITYYWEVWS